MRCTQCDHENPAGSGFCNACGTPLERRCARCERRNPPGAHFCNGCGVSLTEDAAPPATPAPERDPRDYTPRHLVEKILDQKAGLEGERRLVTVMFADLAASTGLAEIVDAERMHGLLDRAFGLILECVHRYEGTVNQFTGDGVMALFGAPIALEDAPRCAVMTALAIHEALAPLDEEVQATHGRAFRMRIGVHTGPVVVGRIGDDLRMDYTAVGDTTNLAARLEEEATPGHVLISDVTRRGVEGFFDLRALAPLAVRGRSGQVQVHEVVAQRAVGDRIEALPETALTPFVGRKRELEALHRSLDAARAENGQVAFVVGEAGIGKSRLLHEFRATLDTDAVLWIEGRCASFARATPFYCVADALRRWVGIEERDDETAATARFDAFERDQGGGLAWTLPYLRRLLSLPSQDDRIEDRDAMSRRSETCRALQALLLRAAAAGPVVFVVEDLHWIDAASEEFLGFLADSVPATRVLLVFTHRPGYSQPFGDRSYHVRIPLQALGERAMSEMVHAVLDAEQLPDALRVTIAEKADGNPLFVEEVTRSLLEEGVLALKQGRVRLTRDLQDVAIPNRIQDVLMARLDRLPDEPKRAIQVASVIGREFALRLLARITEVDERLDQIVAELRALELIYEKASHPELAYMFKHALTHDVAYESMLLQRRKALHLVVGTAIEELYRDRIEEHFEALAHHFDEAEDWDRAFRYHEFASAKSAHAYANQSAVEHCRKALAMAERVAEPVHEARIHALTERLAECHLWLSEFRQAAEAFRRAAALCDDPGDRALAHARAAFCDLWGHDYAACEQGEVRAIELAEPAGADAAHAFALCVRDERLLVHGRSQRDDAEAVRALALAERSGATSIIVAALAQLAQRATWRGEFRRAVALADRGCALAVRQQAPSDAIFAHWFLGISTTAVGDYGRGVEVIRAGLDLCERVGDRALKARLLNTLGWAYAEFGCHTHAMDYNRVATELAQEMVALGLVPGAPELYANAAINLAGNLVALGEPEAALEQVAPIHAELDESDDPWMRWRYALHVHHVSARIDLALGEPERALAHVEQEVAGARRAGARKLEARGLEVRGRALCVMDRRPEAAVALDEAVAVARAIEYPPVLWRALALQSVLHRRDGDGDTSAARLADARQVIDAHVAKVGEGDRRREFAGLGARLLEDPLRTCR